MLAAGLDVPGQARVRGAVQAVELADLVPVAGQALALGEGRTARKQQHQQGQREGKGRTRGERHAADLAGC